MEQIGLEMENKVEEQFRVIQNEYLSGQLTRSQFMKNVHEFLEAQYKNHQINLNDYFNYKRRMSWTIADFGDRQAKIYSLGGSK